MVKKTRSKKSLKGYTPSARCLPSGQYYLISCDMDTTGRKFTDEICQIAAYTPTSQFSQYVMPHANLHPGARRRHNIRVTSDGRFRVLRSNIDNKVIRTKSEISALTEFLSWLENEKSKAGQTTGIVLIFHDSKKMVSYMLLEAFQRYNLLEKFHEIVKGFANNHALSEAKCSTTLKSYNVRVLSRVLLNRQVEIDSAAKRAKLIWDIVQHFAQVGAEKNLGIGTDDPNRVTLNNMIEVIRQYSYPISIELRELKDQRIIAERNTTFQPIFRAATNMNNRDIQRINILRTILAEGNLDYKALKTLYEINGRQGLIIELGKLKISCYDQKNDLLEILDSHFDSRRTAVFPNTRIEKKNSNKKPSKPVSSNESRVVSPDTTTTTSPLKNAVDNVMSQ